MADQILATSLHLLCQELKNLRTGRQPTTFEIAKVLEGRVEKFSGEGELPFTSWLQTYTDVLTRFNVNVELGKTLLPLYLIDGAKVHYDTIQNPETKDWAAITTELATLLKNPFVIENAKDDLYYTTQGADTVGRFADRIKKKCIIAFQGQGDQVIQREMIDHFIRGLRSDIKAHMRRLHTKPQKFQDAVAIAEREAKTIEQEKFEALSTIMQTHTTVNSVNLEKRIEALENQIRDPETQRNYGYNRNYRGDFPYGDANDRDEQRFDDRDENGNYMEDGWYDEEADDNWNDDNDNENYRNDGDGDDGNGYGNYDEDGWYDEEDDWNDGNNGYNNNFEVEHDGWYPPN